MTIERRGDAFTIDGQATFLILVSYFDGLEAGEANWERDFTFFRNDAHIDGIRVFPNWWNRLDARGVECDTNTVVSLTAPSPYVQQARLDTLKRLIEAANRHHLVVEVAMSRETLCGVPMYPAWPSDHDRTKYLTGVAAVASQSQGYGNVLFDAQNEWNYVFGGETTRELQEVRRIKDAIKTSAPLRLVVASMDMNGSATVAASTVLDHGMDAVAFHEPRGDRTWYDSSLEATINALRLALGQTRAPI